MRAKEVKIAKEVISCDVSSVVMFLLHTDSGQFQMIKEIYTICVKSIFQDKLKFILGSD